MFSKLLNKYYVTSSEIAVDLSGRRECWCSGIVKTHGGTVGYGETVRTVILFGRAYVYVTYHVRFGVEYPTIVQTFRGHPFYRQPSVSFFQ